MDKRDFHCFDKQIVSFDSSEKVDFNEINFIESFNGYVQNHPNTEVILFPTDGLTEQTIAKLEGIIKSSNGMVRWAK